jgi:multiple sugar transport system permease protein
MARRKITKRIIIHILAVIIGIIVIFPFLVTLLYSTKNYIDVITEVPPKLYLHWNPIMKNYRDVLFTRNFIYFIRNSLIITISTTIIALVIGLPAAYGLSRFKFKNHNFLATWILSNRFLPPVAFAVPIFLLIRNLKLLNTYIGLIIPYAAFALPFVIWIMIGFFDEIPVSIDESAMIDGATRINAFIRVILPLSGPGLVATSIFTLIFTWHEFLVGLFISVTQKVQTLAIGGASIISAESPLFHNLTSTVGVVTVMPIILITFFLSKYIVSGMTLGAVKQ